MANMWSGSALPFERRRPRRSEVVGEIRAPAARDHGPHLVPELGSRAERGRGAGARTEVCERQASEIGTGAQPLRRN